MATPNKFRLIIMITFLVFVFVKADDPVCIIPSGFFDGIVVDSSVAEPYYGFIGKRNHAPIQRTIFSCLPMYCDFDPCDCSYQNKKETTTDNFIYAATCFLKKIITYSQINFCLNGYIEDELHNCRAQFSCNINNGGCDQLCKHNDISNADFCACNPGYFRYYDGKNGTCQDCKKFGCQQNCAADPAGGVICSCNEGYILDSDKYTCRAKYSCNNQNGGCQQKCSTNIVGVFVCSCNEGFVLNSDEKTCTAKTSPASVTDPSNSLGLRWEYILAIALGILLLIIILLIIAIVCMRNKTTSTHVEKTTVVHYEKSGPRGSEPTRIYITPNNCGGDGGEGDGTRNLRALSATDSPQHDNQYARDEYDYIDDHNPVYKQNPGSDKRHKTSSKTGSKTSSKNNSKDPSSHKNASKSSSNADSGYSGNSKEDVGSHGNVGRQASGKISDYADAGSHGNKVYVNDGKTHGNEDVGYHGNASKKGKERDGDHASGKNHGNDDVGYHGNGSKKDKEHVSNQASGKNHGNEDVGYHGSASNKGKEPVSNRASGKNHDNENIGYHGSRASGKSHGNDEQMYSKADKSGRKASDNRSRKHSENEAKQVTKGNGRNRSLSTSAHGSGQDAGRKGGKDGGKGGKGEGKAENAYAGSFEGYDLQNSENELSAKPKFEKSVSVDAGYANMG